MQHIRVLPKGIQLLPPKIDAHAQRTVYDALLRKSGSNFPIARADQPRTNTIVSIRLGSWFVTVLSTLSRRWPKTRH